ncbi:uncharacterized protein LOC111374488 [Olea europaea var. sylvestris]|uniref:uncharacterized protein LOC111374488 n=1 Tax=Olea europaea var. sylvestris TaxID=158386 RepID=UPI000C1D2B66|nr:uncharacterized protein LOC111374488 [Olea europaea var. sylvestris]
MMPKLISWNVRGLNEISKKLGVRYQFLGSSGVSGGVLVMWDTRVLEMKEASIWVFSISISFKNCEDGFRWMFTGVYGLSSDDSRVGLWNELAGMRAWWNLPTCIGGNFNVIRFPSERSSGGRLTRAMEEFSDFIRENLLVDLPMIGEDFTWSSNRDRPVLSRIDRFLICGEWESNIQMSLRENWGAEKIGEGFRERVQTWWTSYEVSGSPCFVLNQKLKALKGDLKKWNEEVVGNVNCSKNQCLSEIEELDRREESQGLTGEEKERHRVLKEEMERMVEMVEINWRQKSRVTWLKEGDKCAKFFHRVANSNRRNNSITVLEVDGVTYEEPQQIGSQLVNFYQNLYREQFEWRPELEGLHFSTITEDDAR